MLFWTDYFEEEEKYIFYRHFNFYSKNIQDLIKISKKIYSKFGHYSERQRFKLFASIIIQSVRRKKTRVFFNSVPIN